MAWARSISQEEYYLAVWKDEKSWQAAAQGQGRVEVRDLHEIERQVLTGFPEMITAYDTEEEAIKARQLGRRERENE